VASLHEWQVRDDPAPQDRAAWGKDTTMRTLFVATAAFAALVMVAPIGNAHAAPYDSEARQPSPMGMAVYACGGFYPVDKKTGDAVIETAAADDADAASGSDRWSTLDDKRAILAMHCLAV
jgi:hypothetical protein